MQHYSLNLFSRYTNAKKHLIQWSNDICGKKTILIYAIHTPFIKAAVESKRRDKDIKICLIVPDLPEFMGGKSNYFYALFRMYQNKLLVKYLKEIARRASVRYALGPKMARALTERYHLDFECIHNADDITRFHVCEHERPSDDRVIIGFTGSLYFGRTAGLSDLARACELLNRKFKIVVYCSSVPEDTPADLLTHDTIEFRPLPSHDELPHVLSKCNILFLPESFDPAYRKAIELSISSKSHLYMMGGRPVLVYGPPWSGTVNYARSSGWGVVVDKRDDRELARGLYEVSSPITAKEIVAKAYSVAKRNHDIVLLRKRILERLTHTVKDFAL